MEKYVFHADLPFHIYVEATAREPLGIDVEATAREQQKCSPVILTAPQTKIESPWCAV